MYYFKHLSFRSWYAIIPTHSTCYLVSSINSFWTIVSGERFQHDDPKLAKLVSCVMQ
jgi:hypothetical protein